MSITVRLLNDDLHCKSEADALAAAQLVASDRWHHPHRMTVAALCSSYPPHDSGWYLEVNHFDGDHWQDSQAEGLWIALTPHLADGATLEFEDEEGDRWRIRWHKGHLFQEHVKRVLWDVSREITPPQKEITS